MEQATIIGIVSIWTGISLLPQLIKINQDKNSEDVSLSMLSVFFIGFGLFIYYGYIQQEWAIVVSNTFSWMVSVAIFVLYFKYKQKKAEVKPSGRLTRF